MGPIMGPNNGIHYNNGSPIVVMDQTDSEWAGQLDRMALSCHSQAVTGVCIRFSSRFVVVKSP